LRGRTREIVTGCLLAAALAGEASGQAIILLGGEVGVGHRGLGDEMDSFIGSYNEVNDTSLASPLEDPGGVTSLSYGVRFHTMALPFVFGTGLGGGGYETTLEAELNDGGGRRIDVKVSDFVASIDVAYGAEAGRNLFYLGPTVAARVRETTITSVRRFADGSSDEGDSPPVSALSGEFTGSVAQFYAGATAGAMRVVAGNLVLTFRASATIPVGEYAISLDERLARSGDDGRFPVDVAELAAGPVAEDNAMRIGMDAIEFEITGGIAFGGSW
jgi:hypothetical protein